MTLHICFALLDISAELINIASHSLWLTVCPAFLSKWALHALLSPLRPPSPIVPLPTRALLARKGRVIASGHIWWVLGAQTTPSVPRGCCGSSPHPPCLACQWLCCFSTLLWLPIPTAAPASEAAAGVPQWSGNTCLHFLVIMNIILCIHSTASLDPFGMKNMSPLDVSTGLCRTQRKNVDLQIFFSLRNCLHFTNLNLCQLRSSCRCRLVILIGLILITQSFRSCILTRSWFTWSFFCYWGIFFTKCIPWLSSCVLGDGTQCTQHVWHWLCFFCIDINATGLHFNFHMTMENFLSRGV